MDDEGPKGGLDDSSDDEDPKGGFAPGTNIVINAIVIDQDHYSSTPRHADADADESANSSSIATGA